MTQRDHKGDEFDWEVFMRIYRWAMVYLVVSVTIILVIAVLEARGVV